LLDAKRALEIVEKFIKGQNALIFTYGVTSSGKAKLFFMWMLNKTMLIKFIFLCLCYVFVIFPHQHREYYFVCK